MSFVFHPCPTGGVNGAFALRLTVLDVGGTEPAPVSVSLLRDQQRRSDLHVVRIGNTLAVDFVEL